MRGGQWLHSFSANNASETLLWHSKIQERALNPNPYARPLRWVGGFEFAFYYEWDEIAADELYNVTSPVHMGVKCILPEDFFDALLMYKNGMIDINDTTRMILKFIEDNAYQAGELPEYFYEEPIDDWGQLIFPVHYAPVA